MAITEAVLYFVVILQPHPSSCIYSHKRYMKVRNKLYKNTFFINITQRKCYKTKSKVYFSVNPFHSLSSSISHLLIAKKTLPTQHIFYHKYNTINWPLFLQQTKCHLKHILSHNLGR